ncbi:MAG: hypothetical protein LUQ32_00065 [Methanomicrobiales archaeon]|nr:hypothetical protein [Methanomicrobiales archaeon]
MSAWIRASFRRPVLVYFILLALGILVLPALALGAGETLVYSTDFSTDPGWTTNNPATNYYDREKGMFHYLMRDGSGTYVNVRVPYHGESFSLSFDILPERTDFQASVKFGLGDDDQVSVQRLTMFTEFQNSPYGRLIWLRSIDPQNQRREASSYYLSYGGPTVQFADGTWYHVVMDYRADSRSLTLSVIRRNDSHPVWHYSLDQVSIFPTMNRIYMSKIGDSTNPNAIAEGSIDNVAFSLISPPETGQPAGQQSATGPPSSPSGTEQRSVTPPDQTSPTSKPVPLSALSTIFALAASLIYVGIGRVRGH